MPFQHTVDFDEQLNAPDCYNYKNGGDTLSNTFDRARYHIWRYMLSDNSGEWYSGQPGSCRFSGIDSNGGSSYNSAMNYDKPLLVDYSTGINGSSDHNDWHALRLQDFTTHHIGDPQPAFLTAEAKKMKKFKGSTAIDHIKTKKQHLKDRYKKRFLTSFTP